MLAKCFPSILPDLTFEESLEVTKIHSVAGVLDANKGIVIERPFRSPHHTATAYHTFDEPVAVEHVKVHAGMDIGFPPPCHAMPEHMKRALGWFDSPVVAAHWGGCYCPQEVLEKLCGENIFFDLSFGYSNIPKCIAQAIVDKHGPEKLLFGSDMPWHRPAWEMRLVESLDLSAEDKEKIYWRNAQGLLGMRE